MFLILLVTWNLVKLKAILRRNPLQKPCILKSYVKKYSKCKKVQQVLSEVLLKWWNALIIVQKFKKMMPNLIHRWNEKWSFALRISSSFVQWSKAKLFQTLFQDNSKYGNDGLYNFFWYIFLLYHILVTLSYT